MVHIAQSFAFIITLIVSCLATAASPATIATDMQNMMDTAISLEQTFKGINSVNWPLAGMTLQNGVTFLISGVNQCTNDITAVQPLSENDGSDILNVVQRFTASALQFPVTLSQNKVALEKLPIVGPVTSAVVLNKLQLLQPPLLKLGEAMVAAMPDPLTANATALKNSLDNALNSAIQTYSN